MIPETLFSICPIFHLCNIVSNTFQNIITVLIIKLAIQYSQSHEIHLEFEGDKRDLRAAEINFIHLSRHPHFNHRKSLRCLLRACLFLFCRHF